MVAPLPMTRYLVPEPSFLAPEGFAQIEDKMLGGLPHRLSVNAEFNIVVVVPTGLAVTWRDIDPTTLVSCSDLQIFQSTLASAKAIRTKELRSPARIIVRRGGGIAASIPLTAGLRRTIPEGDQAVPGSQIEVMILGWEIRAGSLRGPGDYGSWISLAWRRTDQGADSFSPPASHQYAIPRLEPNARMESVSISPGEAEGGV